MKFVTPLIGQNHYNERYKTTEKEILMLTLKIMGTPSDHIASEHIKNQTVIMNTKTLATIKGTGNEVEFHIDPHLDLDEFQFLRDIVMELSYGNEDAIDERGCQLGYLENGEKAFLIKNWEEWKAFLMKAKLRTLEGQNVQALNEVGEELGAGILAEYEVEAGPFRIRSCTLITLFGERKFEGDNIRIVPTNQFG
ncbi:MULTISPECIES: hypothetical protein [unclassified Mesobacillus]|jgi:hypothetical protein|uniref:hypothetical protein n=1 Tax=unclassified Mesobacillus TaxID=2675270 RepID=UPI00203C1C7D|nr:MULTISPECIES: hypothetical protein [unclassified Mesobacillus]MCM3124592.1 hypothetical protein [Mesobacillus sp. MER 33]MCM3234698.1 hypothetical protein [Mesobacillus sp. MER 48]